MYRVGFKRWAAHLAAAALVSLASAGARAADPPAPAFALRAETIPSPQSARADVGTCRPPKSLCATTLHALEQGGFLDFRTGEENELAPPRLLSPFAVLRGEALDRSRCPGRLCAGHDALGGLMEDLLKHGYYTQSATAANGSAVVTLRSERIDADMKVLKGSCRFNLDQRCQDPNAWLQQDRRTGEACGFAQTRVFVVATTAPELVSWAAFETAERGARGGAEALRTVAFDAVRAKVYELVYVHKVCRSEITLIRNG
jgi:hypothetical protein